jgi:hypothetical protein
VPQVYGRAALLGYGDGVRAPAGFTGGAGVLDFVASGRWSLLYFWDSPGFVRGYFAAFLAIGALFVLGWRTRLTGRSRGCCTSGSCVAATRTGAASRCTAGF